ncbi:MAG: ParA family protein [Tepidisphaeraceae bacterium]
MPLIIKAAIVREQLRRSSAHPSKMLAPHSTLRLGSWVAADHVLHAQEPLIHHMPQSIAFVNGKGGTGKSTLCLMIATVLQLHKQRVRVDDRDPQGNSTAAAQQSGIPTEGEADFVLIDTCPDIERPSTLAAIREADLVVIVTRPEFFDVASTLATAQVVQRERPADARTCVVFNQVRPQTLVAKEMLDTKSRIPFPVLSMMLPQRAAYSRANRFGWNTLTPKERVEVLELSIQVLDLLSGSRV